ncbi:MAG: RNA polymerase subunit sigma-24 [Bacteroidetes bacterium]|nr:MAG: RNA polymerase subunit sigma-24 [Bacteroidota bacterium]MBL1145691.1 sigma-70 family RNA polymerase sigma factor [Bacteroidota bacterium]NOG58485.1 sigma-70 family RNA polymerase sigma factor [Bacteroidota bacterium]
MTLKEIYNQFADLVYTLAYKYLRNKEESEEATQDVFIKVHTKLGQFRNEAGLKTWIYKITINVCLDIIKSNQRNKRSIYKNSVNIEETKIGLKENPESQLIQNENTELLLACVNQLSDNQKMAFLLSKEEGISNPEIAKMMNTSISSVESLIFRAKANLKIVIAEKWPEYSMKKKK